MYFPMQIMYRCFLLARTLLIYELMSIFAPDEITIDLYELLKTRGGFLFNSFCGPNGYAGEDLQAYAGHFSSASKDWRRW